MVTDINYGYTGGYGKHSSCLQRNTMETYWNSFSGPWTSRVAKIIKYFIENIPKQLFDAHIENDKAVMRAYGFIIKEMSEADCVAALMKMYQELVAGKNEDD